MDPITIGLIGSAALSAAGSLGGGLIGAGGQQAVNAQQMQFNAQQAQLNRDFQERMSNTAYQRAMSDMRAAGLNPILAANLGGASTPGGDSASVSLGNPGALLGAGVSSAAQAGQRFLDMKATLSQAQKDASVVPVNESTVRYNEANTRFVTAQEGLAQQNTVTSAAHAAQLISQTDNINQDTKNKLIDNLIKTQQASSAASQAIIDRRTAEDVTATGTSKLGIDLAAILRILKTAGLDIQKKNAPGAPTPSPSPSVPYVPGPRGNTVLDSPVPQTNILSPR